MKTIRETRQVVIDKFMNQVNFKDGDVILEPSAGVGLLADGIKRHCPGVTVHTVELNQECRNELYDKGYNIVGNDFFLFNPKIKYDYVIGAPNFRNNVDCNHVIKMYDCVKDGGIVVSIMSPCWMTGDTYIQINFRKWLEDKKYQITILPDNSYMEEGKTVPTILIKIIK